MGSKEKSFTFIEVGTEEGDTERNGCTGLPVDRGRTGGVGGRIIEPVVSLESDFPKDLCSEDILKKF